MLFDFSAPIVGALMSTFVGARPHHIGVITAGVFN